MINHSHGYSNAELPSSPVLVWAPEQTHRSLNTFILSLICGWTEHWGRCLHQGHGTKEFLPALAFLFLQSSSSFSFAVLRRGFGGFGGSPGFICKEKSVTLSPGQHDLCLLFLIDLCLMRINKRSIRELWHYFASEHHSRSSGMACRWPMYLAQLDSHPIQFKILARKELKRGLFETHIPPLLLESHWSAFCHLPNPFLYELRNVGVKAAGHQGHGKYNGNEVASELVV